MRAPTPDLRRRWRNVARGCAGAFAALALTFAAPAVAQEGEAMQAKTADQRQADKPCPSPSEFDHAHAADVRAEREAERTASMDRDDPATSRAYAADRDRRTMTEKTETTQTTRMTKTDRELTDAAIRNAIDRQLRNARGVQADPIDVEISQGVVTLSGTVDNLLAQQRAERIASTVKGVREVRNDLKVEATDERSSVELTAAVQQALRRDPATDAWQIDVRAEDGRVTLTGTVDSYQEKRLAERIAQRVRGVEEIDNQIDVSTIATRNAREIENEIESALMWDARVDDASIDVAVQDGTVALTGTVGSAYERALAIADAWMPGVTEVDATGLEVQWDARDEMRGAERFADRDETDVRQAVTAALQREPRVSEFDTDVTVDDGVVTLTGVVDNAKAKRSAAQAAADVQGVRRVENYLKVRPAQELDDQAVASNVRTALENDPYVERYEVDVAVRDGIARLTGEVDSYFEMWQAGDVAASVNGVRQVNNRLRVGYQPADYGAWFYDWDPLGNDFDHTYDTPWATNRTDSEISEEIRDELFWSPFVDADEVNVSVDNGRATLTGTVDTWSERRAATEQAVEGGALTIDNQLEVEWAQDRIM